MYFKAATLDDLLRRVIERLIGGKSERNRFRINPTKGWAVEIVGVFLRLTNPRARLSRTANRGIVLSSLGELAWYLSKSDALDFIQYYISAYEKFSDDKTKLYGAYGPRLFNYEGRDLLRRNLFTEIQKLLNQKPESRQAFLPIFSPEDVGQQTEDLPCTSSLQFFVRKRRLHLVVYMRSNDVFLGMPHDIFCFTMLQEIMSRSLGLELGSYTHLVGSLHLYEENRAQAKEYLAEGWQPTRIAMPGMPLGDPWKAVDSFLELEQAIRLNGASGISHHGLHPYWADLVRLLLVYSHAKNCRWGEIRKISKEMHCKVYETYIRKRLTGKPEKRIIKEQLPLNERQNF